MVCVNWEIMERRKKHRSQTSDLLKLIPAFTVKSVPKCPSKQIKLPLSLRPRHTASGLTLIKRVSRDLDSVTAAINRIRARLVAMPDHSPVYEGKMGIGGALTERPVSTEKVQAFPHIKRFRLLRHS
jgi:hypothetical protein